MPSGQLITKVWIEDGCIVCDACQTTCPEVFEVQAESCIIRPEALAREFLQSRSRAIRLAAEECPVEVIRFESATPAS
jgi:ferredoxin